ncbi:MAG: T9SS type A sorting domain-containing protein [candidate division WOR-3 bacterium]
MGNGAEVFINSKGIEKKLELIGFTGSNIYEFSYANNWQQNLLDSTPVGNYIMSCGKARNDSLNRIYVGCGNGYIYEYTWIDENIDEKSRNFTKGLFSVYPNPFSYKTNLILNTQPSKNPLFEIYDIQGRLVDEIEISSTHSKKFTISWPDRNINFPAGIYFCIFKDRNNLQTIKMIKLR